VPGLDGLFDGNQHFDLGGHVKRGGRFIENHEIGLRAQRHGGHGTLQLAARYLMRITFAEMLRIRQAKHGKKLYRAFLGVGALHQPVPDRGFDNLIDQAMGGIEGSRCGLRHIGDMAAAHCLHVLARQRQNVAAIERHCAAGNLQAAARVPERCKADGRFACAGFADEAEHTTFGKGQVDLVDDNAVVGADFQTGDFKQGFSPSLNHYPAHLASGSMCAARPNRQRN
jgi:hypothetical protein